MMMTSFTLKEVKQRLNDKKYETILSEAKVSPASNTNKRKRPEVEILHRGISIGFLIALTESCNLQNYETHRVVSEFIAPVSANTPSTVDNDEKTDDDDDHDDDDDDDDNNPCRFAELACFSQYFGEADTFVSHCWKGKWGDLVAAVSQGYPITRKVWIDIFAVTQHPQFDALQDDLGALEYVIESVHQGTTLVWNPETQTDEDSNPVMRAWCLFEIHTTVISDNALVIKMGKYNDDETFSMEKIDFIPEKDEDVITKLVFETDIRNAKATMPEDLQRIHSIIQKQGGFDELNTRVRTAVYNNWRILQIPAVKDALSGSKEKVLTSLQQHDPNTYEGDPGGSILHDCVHGNFCAAAELVIECGAQIDKQTDKGNTPLMFAAEGGRARMSKMLLQNGASLDLQNKRKETALHLAAKYGRVEVVTLLLEEGADKNILDSGNYNPAGLAGLNKMPGCKDALKILQRNDASNLSLLWSYCCQ